WGTRQGRQGSCGSNRRADTFMSRRQPCLTPSGDVVSARGGTLAASSAPTRGQCQGGVTVRLKVHCAPPYPSTTMKYVCPAVTVGVRREARNRPVELAHASSLHPASDPLAHPPLRR